MSNDNLDAIGMAAPVEASGSLIGVDLAGATPVPRDSAVTSGSVVDLTSLPGCGGEPASPLPARWGGQEPPAALLQRQLEAIDAWNAFRRARESPIATTPRSRDVRAYWARDLKVLTRTHQALLDRTADQLARDQLVMMAGRDLLRQTVEFSPRTVLAAQGSTGQERALFAAGARVTFTWAQPPGSLAEWLRRILNDPAGPQPTPTYRERVAAA